MERNFNFVEGNFYHVYNRGIDKRKIFFSGGDWDHFQKLLFLRNGTKHVKASRVQRLPLDIRSKGENLVDICAYTLMPNHFHILVYEKSEGGTSKFMSKLLTAYSLYMNIKYERTGPLMCRPFRARYVNSDEYLRWLFAYIHLNPVELMEDMWKENGIQNQQKVREFLREYRYSSYTDYFIGERDESKILNKAVLPIAVNDLEDTISMVKEYQANVQRLPLDIG